MAAAILLVCTVFWLALTSGYEWRFAALPGAAALLGVYLASKPSTRDAGRGLVVSLLLALVATSVSHREGAARDARNNLRVTLSSDKNLTGIDLRGRDLSGVYLVARHVSGARLSGADLSHAFLGHSTLRMTDLRRANLSDADLSFSDLRGADLRAARLNGADLTEANLGGARLAGAQLRRAKLDGARLDGADLREADLRSATLLGTHLGDALLNDADLRGADFASDDFRPTELDGAGLKDVRTDSHTRWPPGFDPERATAEAAAPPSTKVAVPPDAAEDVVSRVGDGDTIELRDLGPVRLLGIDAPSTEGPADCYGLEAKKAVEQLLPPGTRVLYALGNTTEDAYHRKLAYLWRKVGWFVNERLVADGDATFLRPPHKGRGLPSVEGFYARGIKRAAIRAAMLKRGLWGACPAAGGQTPSS